MKFLIYKSKFTFEPTNIKNIKIKKMKKILFLLATVLFLACNNTQAQNTTIEGAFTPYGSGTANVFTGTGSYVDTAYFKASIPSTGAVTITLTLASTGSSIDSISGVIRLYASLDGVNYFPYPNAADSTTTLTTVVPNVYPTAIPFTTAGGHNTLKSWTRVWQFPNATASVATTASVGASTATTVNAYSPYKYYMIRVITSALGTAGATSKTWTLSARYLCRRLSAY